MSECSPDCDCESRKAEREEAKFREAAETFVVRKPKTKETMLEMMVRLGANGR